MLLMNKIYNILTIDDEPPTLYSLMQSKVNYKNPNPVSIENLPNAFRPYLFDFDYPINNGFKEDFENTFLEHYMFRSIGFETYTSFKIHLKVKLKSIMPKYNKMLEGFYKLDFTGIDEKHIKETVEIGASQGTTTNDNRFSNLPQNEIEDVQNGSYMTDYTYNEGSSNMNANRNANENLTINKLDTIDEYKKFMDSANNIYELIFKECDCLFFGVIEEG